MIRPLRLKLRLANWRTKRLNSHPMRVDLFDFALPEDRIALRPASPRDSARMLVLDGDATHDRLARDLPDCLRAGDILVFNDTKVIPAQLEGRRGEAKIGATLHKREGLRQWRAFIRNAKRLRDGDQVEFATPRMPQKSYDFPQPSGD